MLDVTDPVVQRILASLGVIVVAFGLARLGRLLVTRATDDPHRRYRSTRLIGRVLVAVAAVVLMVLWAPDQATAITVLTVVGTGLAIALREVLLSLFGRAAIAVRTLYELGDRIEINGVRGDVVDIRVLHTVLMEVGGWVEADQSSGRLVHVPNSWTLQHAVQNYTHGLRFIWNELSFTLTFQSNWEKAEALLRSLAEPAASIVEHEVRDELRALSREFLIYYTILSPFVYVSATEQGVRLTLRYLCEVRKRRGTEHAFTVSFLKALRAHDDVELAYPMRGLYPYDRPGESSEPGETAKSDAYDGGAAAPGASPEPPAAPPSGSPR